MLRNILAVPAGLLALAGILAAYDALVLMAIRYGLIGDWRTDGVPFVSLLVILPIALAIVTFETSRRRLHLSAITIAFAGVAAIVLLFINMFVLGCHPIWVGRGACT